MLADAGYATRVVPPLPPRRIPPLPVSERDWSHLNARLVTATADAYRATTVDQIHAAVAPVVSPDYGVLERLAALLDTAGARLSAIDPDGIRARALIDALQQASTLLSELGNGIETADLADTATAVPVGIGRAQAARTRTDAEVPQATTEAQAAKSANVPGPRRGL
ncbi:hypothetical protein [Streptacidiphilus sp. MAP5-52]|uniref:hypothetical protein n=1 Tax=Streptacidiphilus sp. MAP5-52 TaxID=3156267 RepID=UPI0035184261